MLCLVVMPAGAAYEHVIAPAVRAAGLEPLRADPGTPVFEALVLAERAVVDIATADAEVHRALGAREALRPLATVLVGADPDAAAVTAALREPLDRGAPAWRLLAEPPRADIARLKTDVFRDRARYSPQARERLAQARADGVDALRRAQAELGELEDAESGVLVDLLLSYRAVGAWQDVIALVERLPRPLAATVLVREQLGLALNRAGRGEEAEAVLRAVIEQHGPSSETCALLGRVHKDAGRIDEAIDAYRAGFEADWRDAYPGVNAVTLMEIREPGGAEQAALLPIVRYAVQRRIAGGEPDYWDHATLLELAVLARDRGAAAAAADAALAAVREPWEPASTASNLRLIREARGDAPPWAAEIERRLLAASGRGAAPEEDAGEPD